MRLSVAFKVVVLLAFVFTASAVEKSDISKGPSDNDPICFTIKLTEAQAEKVANAGGETVTITLTEKQVNAIKKAIPGYEVAKEIELKPSHIGSGSEVTIELLFNGKSIHFTSTPPNQNKTPISR